MTIKETSHLNLADTVSHYFQSHSVKYSDRIKKIKKNMQRETQIQDNVH